MEDQPPPADASPTALLLGHIVDFNPEENEEDPEEDPADYPIDGGDNDDNESFYDNDDDDNIKKGKEDEEEEEHLALADPFVVPIDDHIQAEDIEAFKTNESASTPPTSPHHIILFSETKSCVKMMTTTNQGMSVEEIEPVVAQRVANVIEAIAIYETKTNIAHKSMIQTKRQEDKVSKNARNKKKWEGNHNGSSSQQNKGHKVPGAHTAWPINKKAYDGSLPLCNECKFHHNRPCTVKYGKCKKVGHIIQNYRTPATVRNQKTRTCYECGSLRHYRSESPIAKFQKRMDMIHGGVRESKPKNNSNKKQPNKRQNTSRAYTAGHREKKHYGGSKPSSTNANTTNNQKGIKPSQKATCYECGKQEHYRRDCPEQKNQNYENQIKSTKARGVVHVFRGGETEQDLNKIEDEIEA
uniref:CCHC-type domain-containing protein n=1 Tax=Tanacetum cinerariifolium TaxID=118510 RepID=A0A6L2MRD7_TANCI|nr:hypothetical protein [Tanacetum cinerariifolium]